LIGMPVSSTRADRVRSPTLPWPRCFRVGDAQMPNEPPGLSTTGHAPLAAPHTSSSTNSRNTYPLEIDLRRRNPSRSVERARHPSVQLRTMTSGVSPPPPLFKETQPMNPSHRPAETGFPFRTVTHPPSRIKTKAKRLSERTSNPCWTREQVRRSPTPTNRPQHAPAVEGKARAHDWNAPSMRLVERENSSLLAPINDLDLAATWLISQNHPAAPAGGAYRPTAEIEEFVAAVMALC